MALVRLCFQAELSRHTSSTQAKSTMLLMPYIYIYYNIIQYSGFLSREKSFTNFAFLWRFRESFSAKIYFSSRASGRGALGYRKFAKVISTKIYFQAIREIFLRERKPLYGTGSIVWKSILNRFIKLYAVILPLHIMPISF